MEKERIRVNTYMPKEILDKLDEYAAEMGVNRTAMITIIVKQHLDQQEVLKNMPRMGYIYDEIMKQQGKVL